MSRASRSMDERLRKMRDLKGAPWTSGYIGTQRKARGGTWPGMTRRGLTSITLRQMETCPRTRTPRSERRMVGPARQPKRPTHPLAKEDASSWYEFTAGCIDTGLLAGRRYFGQSDKTLIETANVHHARWVIFTETRCNPLAS